LSLVPLLLCHPHARRQQSVTRALYAARFRLAASQAASPTRLAAVLQHIAAPLACCCRGCLPAPISHFGTLALRFETSFHLAQNRFVRTMSIQFAGKIKASKVCFHAIIFFQQREFIDDISNIYLLLTFTVYFYAVQKNTSLLDTRNSAILYHEVADEPKTIN
jgi:hypothetical protein